MPDIYSRKPSQVEVVVLEDEASLADVALWILSKGARATWNRSSTTFIERTADENFISRSSSNLLIESPSGAVAAVIGDYILYDELNNAFSVMKFEAFSALYEYEEAAPDPVLPPIEEPEEVPLPDGEQV